MWDIWYYIAIIILITAIMEWQNGYYDLVEGRCDSREQTLWKLDPEFANEYTEAKTGIMEDCVTERYSLNDGNWEWYEGRWEEIQVNPEVYDDHFENFYKHRISN